MHFFLILQLWLAPFFNISSLSDLKYNLHKYRENRIFSGKYRIFSEKSAIFADFFPIFLQKIFPPENLFHHHRKPIFRRKIGRKNRFFCPWGAQRDEEEDRNRKNRFKGKFVFFSMGIFNVVYREINGV